MSTNDVSFNLMDRPWLQVAKTDGSCRLMSIIEVLGQSDEIRSIGGDIPLQRFALTRLLIAIMYATFGHDLKVDEWRALFDAGPRDPEVRDALYGYCDMYRGRFDLFDEKRPFYQVAGLHTTKNEVSGLERLVLDVPNGEPFFTTRLGEGLRTMGPAEAARWLVTTQAFDASGIKSGAVGDPLVKGGKGYPIGVAWSGHLGGDLVEGTDLWRTLMLNYVSSRVFGIGDADAGWSDADDVPVWEREPLTQCGEPGFYQPQERTGDPSFCHGPASLMTWQSRRMLLAHTGETVTGVLICNGDRLKPQNAHRHETMTAWRRSDPQQKALKMPLVYMPRKHSPERALWRGLLTVVVDELTPQERGGTPAESLRPLTLQWLTEVNSKVDISDLPVRLHAFGVEYGSNEAVIDATVDDELDMDLVVLSAQSPYVGQMVRNAVQKVDDGVRELRTLSGNVAAAAGMPVDAAKRKADEQGYTAFDQEFRNWLRTLNSGTDTEAAEREWNATARRILLRLGERVVAMAPTRAIVGRAITSRNPKTGVQTTTYVSATVAENWYRRKIDGILPVVSNEGD
ncbi:type I-E CRISPR-associated protein Cse1/CasA [Bifidobacterium sp. MA2]|uniref:Type I-E CRISPR-associated protein Cse1/CasA n=1 Tax=Bifidobacterium santillanense TaxID=2809028 RepID=A0ABS5UNF6_9BIFI|nr:type I-E CRISPR-associated protein Cse1/CasA [Bifidobacterium santillanense]MBT1172414.1 type I-E CRISPR-associated protein Cse1/CasA [Bifidobacterium santillanense]